MAPTPRIQFTNIHKSFANKTVLNGLNLQVFSGESLVIIGGSGTGKSVALKCLLGLLTPDHGDIQVDGTSLLAISARQRRKITRMGMLFQNAALFDSLSIADNIGFSLSQMKISSTKKHQIIEEMLAMVGLERHILSMMPADISTGMRKRVGLARALASQPDILLFDEPTTGLDPIMGQKIDKLIVHAVRQTKATAITITHDIASARRIADRVALLDQGRVIWSGPVNALDIDGEKDGHMTQDVAQDVAQDIVKDVDGHAVLQYFISGGKKGTPSLA